MLLLAPSSDQSLILAILREIGSRRFSVQRLQLGRVRVPIRGEAACLPYELKGLTVGSGSFIS
jgi:hypothetical protein